MSGGAYFIASALIAVLTERFILDRCLGRTRLFAVSTDIAEALAGAAITAVMLTAGVAVTWLIAAVVLVPLGAVNCSATVLVAVICVLALAGEWFFARRRPFPEFNRIFMRAAVTGSLLGFLTVVPQIAGYAVSFAGSVKTAALAGAVFVAVRFLYNGVRETIGNGRQNAASPVRELAAAGLLALVLGGISALNFFR